MINDYLVSWEDWEESVLTFFSYILIELKRQPNLPKNEASKKGISLNWLLDIQMQKKHGRWLKQNSKCYFPLPIFDARNQPYIEDTTFHISTNKEPEFTIQYFDADLEKTIFYHIECKCLDLPYSASCKYYVEGGVLRFINRSHSYSIGAKSGLMIGYVQSGELPKYLQNVNKYADDNKLNLLVLEGKWEIDGVSRSQQTLNRPENFPPPEFLLHHFWIDLRQNYD